MKSLGWLSCEFDLVQCECKSSQVQVSPSQKERQETQGKGSVGLIFAGYVPLASQSPYPIIVNFWSILWPIIGPILVTFGHCSSFLVYLVAN